MASNTVYRDIKALGRRLAANIDHDGQATQGLQAIFTTHFACHMKGISKYAKEEAKCHYCQLQKLSTWSQYPITITNNVDKEGLPEKFQFVDQVVPSAAVSLPDEAFISSCECDPLGIDSPCVTNKCHCLSDIDVWRIPGGKKNAYHRDGQLRSAYLEGRFPIYECGPQCTCNNRCPNRVVQRGRTVALEIFKTEDGRGWGKMFLPRPPLSFTNLLLGVKTKDLIKRGHFVDCYYGELLTAEEAQTRRDEAESAQQKDVYLFALDKFTDEKGEDERLHDTYEVDGEFLSGPTRFINHSCDPNLRIFAVVKNPVDQLFHSLAFFAVKDISADTELTFDYLDGVATDNDGDDDRDDYKEKRKCLCGSKNCRGYLF